MPSITGANTQFAFALYCALAAETKGNLIMSPLPFSIALALLLNGADEQTHQEIRDATRFTGMSVEEINAQVLRLQKTLGQVNAGKETFVLANSLWASLPLSFASAFLETGRRYFDVEIGSAPRAELPARISDWSREKTRGRVDMRLKETDFALLSATYFKGEWAIPFREADTKAQDFHPEAGPAHAVPMMSQSGKYPYYDGKTFQAVALRFAAATMCFALPRKGMFGSESIYEIEQNVLRDGWVLTQPFAHRQGLVKLPKFTIRYDGAFLPLLEKLGIRRLFTSFDSLRPAVTHPDGARVTDVLQNSYITVDEKGTEAASVLAMPMMVGAALHWKPPKPFEFIADRPFCFWITENQTDSILFMGRVADPGRI